MLSTLIENMKLNLVRFEYFSATQNYLLHWNNLILHHTQSIASLFNACTVVGFESLYATLICVACSQLEKLRAAILAIRQTHVTSEQDCGHETDQQEEQGQTHSSEELFHHMQRQLNDCIRHHQEIIRFVYK
jgi:hypothetical protein